jgi:hypothetical protein
MIRVIKTVAGRNWVMWIDAGVHCIFLITILVVVLRS